jgi:sulfur carrier protein ThiS
MAAARAAHIPASVHVADVYKNLHTGTWSAKAVQAPATMRGRVVAHPPKAVLADCIFRVNAAGRDKVRATCSKNVHSVVRGAPIERAPAWPQSLVAEVGYNPYLFDSFVVLANGQPIHRAAWVEFPDTPRGARPLPLIVGVYPEDAHLLDAPKAPVDPSRVARMADCRARRGAPKPNGRPPGKVTEAAAHAMFERQREAFAALFPAVSRARLHIVRRPCPDGRVRCAGRDLAWMVDGDVHLLARALDRGHHVVGALLAHELGHAADASRYLPGSEQRADDLAAVILGKPIRYTATDAVQTFGAGAWPRPLHLHK